MTTQFGGDDAERVESSDLDRLVRHVRALFAHDAADRLTHVNEPGDRRRPAPRFYLGRSRVGNVQRVRVDVPRPLADALGALVADEPLVDDLRVPPRHADAYERLLAAHAPLAQRWSGPAFRFVDSGIGVKSGSQGRLTPMAHVVHVTERNADVLRGGFEAWLADVREWQPFVAYAVDGRAVAVCQSVRITRDAHEAGVETLPAFRGLGFAAEVVAAWAQRVRDLGCAPLYSTSWTNAASLRVAAKLALVEYGADFHLA